LGFSGQADNNDARSERASSYDRYVQIADQCIYEGFPVAS
jgi:hypothetical protein